MVFCTVWNRSRTVLDSHPLRNAGAAKSATTSWHRAQDAPNVFCPRTAWPSVYTPSHTDRSDWAPAAAPTHSTTAMRTRAAPGFIALTTVQEEASNGKSWDQ